MSKQTIFALLALAAAAMIAGCAPSASSAGSANTPIAASAGQQETNPPADSPYNQPLMATGGDLVMLHVAPRAIAGQASGC